jgi:DNA-binding SARP family transcriptional activator
MLEVRLFGAGQASYRGHPLPGFPRQQSHALLCYLLLNRRRPHRREHLAAVFWGDHPTHLSRKYLRDALWRLRTALQSTGVPADDYLSIVDDCVSFSGAGPYELDVETFETTIARYRDLSSEQLLPAQAAALAEAVDLYTGDLLEGTYDDWCLYDRERLRLLYLSTLGRLLVFHGVAGSYERGLAYGERLLARDNTREKVHRQMMQLYWHLGERGAALAQYKRCAQILRETLNIRPTRETRHLYQQMIRGQYDPARWPLEPRPVQPGEASLRQPRPALTARTLQRLQRLETTIEEAQAELRGLRNLLAAGAADPDQ